MAVMCSVATINPALNYSFWGGFLFFFCFSIFSFENKFITKPLGYAHTTSFFQRARSPPLQFKHMVRVCISTGSQLVACESARHFETKSWHNLWINFDWYDRYNFANYNRILELGKNFARVCGREAGWRAGGSTSRGSWVVFLLVTSLSESGGEPFETLVQTISGCGTSRLDVLLWESMLADIRWLLFLC